MSCRCKNSAYIDDDFSNFDVTAADSDEDFCCLDDMLDDDGSGVDGGGFVGGAVDVNVDVIYGGDGGGVVDNNKTVSPPVASPSTLQAGSHKSCRPHCDGCFHLHFH